MYFSDIPKVCQILSGNFIPSEEEEHYNRLIRLFMNELLNRISPTDLVPYLYREGVLGRRETEQIKLEERNNGRWHAAWLLLHSLPQRVENWFKIFLKALIESKQPDLAEKLDPDLYLSKIYHRYTCLTHLCRMDSSTSSLWTSSFPIKGVSG